MLERNSLKILILGVNGFIGSYLLERILSSTNWDVYGCDINKTNLEPFLNNNRFHFKQCNIQSNDVWIEQHVEKCDIVIPLVAIAQPRIYIENPLNVFNLDFEENLKIVKHCVKYKKRLVFPSTSEVYGKSSDTEFKEDETDLVLGPVCKTRWIYGCSKQLLDRVIVAYGEQMGLKYTIFRPFNWIGPKLDNSFLSSEGKSRILPQFLYNILNGLPIYLVNGGIQKRCFTDIDDGIDALMSILINDNELASNQIFNIGNPENNYTIKEFSEILINIFYNIPKFKEKAEKVVIIEIDGIDYYGDGYEDVFYRVPAINKAIELLNWKPKYKLEETLLKCVSKITD